MRPEQPRVVIIGGGFGGLRAARGLRRSGVEVTVIDKANHHLFQPLLYQVSTALLPAGDIAAPLRRVLADQPNATVVMGEATDIDVVGRTVTVATIAGEQHDVPYDYLVVAVGAVPNYFGHDQWRPFAPPMKTLQHAVDLRDRILRAFEMAAATHDDDVRRHQLTFAVVGAGPTGVELSGQFAALGRRLLREQFPNLPADQLRIVVADAGDEVLAPFDPELREHTRNQLRELGVELMLGRAVVAIDEDGLTLGAANGNSGEDIVRVATVIWAAGVKPAALTGRLAAAAGAQTDDKGRIKVSQDCTISERPEIFAIGDIADLGGLPGIAEPAIQEGRHVARTIRHRIGERRSPGPFRYRDLGTMATISPFDAVAQVRSLRLHGMPAKAAWAAVHVAFLVGWGNRAAVLSNWAWTLSTGKRGQQVILRSTGSSP